MKRAVYRLPRPGATRTHAVLFVARETDVLCALLPRAFC